jgi:hypothetical protein
LGCVQCTIFDGCLSGSIDLDHEASVGASRRVITASHT